MRRGWQVQGKKRQLFKQVVDCFAINYLQVEVAVRTKILRVEPPQINAFSLALGINSVCVIANSIEAFHCILRSHALRFSEEGLVRPQSPARLLSDQTE